MRISSLLVFFLFLILSFGSVAAEKVIVVPLGGAVGDATVEDVIKGKTFSNSSAKGLSGTMPNNGQHDILPNWSDPTVFHYIPEGYHNGNGKVLGDIDLVAPNIVVKKTIFGVTGTQGYPWGCRGSAFDSEGCALQLAHETGNPSTNYTTICSQLLGLVLEITEAVYCKGGFDI